MTDKSKIDNQNSADTDHLIVKHFEILPYVQTWQAMKDYASCKSPQTDELWVLQHAAVYTKGLRCKQTPDSQASHIPVISVDRGGLMTYHGPGQIILYALIDIHRKGINIKQFVYNYEQLVMNFLNRYNLDGHRIDGAPGVYLDNKKIAAIGIRVRNNKTYHGLSVNFDMDLTPFTWINPCGFESMEVVQIKEFVDDFTWQSAKCKLIEEFIAQFNYSKVDHHYLDFQ